MRIPTAEPSDAPKQRSELRRVLHRVAQHRLHRRVLRLLDDLEGGTAATRAPVRLHMLALMSSPGEVATEITRERQCDKLELGIPTSYVIRQTLAHQSAQRGRQQTPDVRPPQAHPVRNMTVVCGVLAAL